MWVIGTAGHVDHGKSTLVEALTGVHPDRLKEEKKREMTIELGFARLDLPNGEKVGIVDVPGHRDFIENMLAGVGGIDAVLFVVAADEGVMPQTREHLAILDLLQVKAGILVLTKVDLVLDPEWLDLVEQEVREFCQGTFLQNAPLVRVSAVTGAGIGELKTIIAGMLVSTPPKVDVGKPRLPVDRVFTIAGYGTVVTGTLIDGQVSVGDEIQVLPGGQKGRIRGIQNHNQKITAAQPGSRAALNLSGIERKDVQRGDVIVRPGDYMATTRLDASIHLIRDVEVGIKHNAEIKFFIGASEVEGRIRLLGKDHLSPSEDGFAQLELAHPVVAVVGDRFILRRPSPAETLGGGVVLDAQPVRRYKPNDPVALNRLKQLSDLRPEEELLNVIVKKGIITLVEIRQAVHLKEEEVVHQAKALIEGGGLLNLSGESLGPETRLMARSSYMSIRENALQILKNYHQENPTRRGMMPEELKNRLGLRQQDFNSLLQLWLNEHSLVQDGQWLRLPDHQISFTPAQKVKVEQLIGKFDHSPFLPPSYTEARELIGDSLVNALLETGELVRINSEVLFRPSAVAAMVDYVLQSASNATPLPVAEFRDHFQTSRKYSLAFLEYLDELGATRREGEGRVVVDPVKLRKILIDTHG